MGSPASGPPPGDDQVRSVPVEDTHHFDVKGVGEQVDGSNGGQRVTVGSKKGCVPCQAGRIAADQYDSDRSRPRHYREPGSPVQPGWGRPRPGPPARGAIWSRRPALPGPLGRPGWPRHREPLDPNLPLRSPTSHERPTRRRRPQPRLEIDGNGRFDVASPPRPQVGQGVDSIRSGLEE